MENCHLKGGEIEGELDIFVLQHQEEEDGEIQKWEEILIRGNSQGLKSLAKLLLTIAEVNQEEIGYLPDGAREHYLLRPNIELSKNSNNVIVGRLDAKGTKLFYERYIPKKKP